MPRYTSTEILFAGEGWWPTRQPKDERPLTSPPNLDSRFRLQPRIRAWLSAAARLVEAHPGVLLTCLCVLYLSAALAASSVKPLWHDELFTYYIAQSPSLRQMWTDLRTRDLNPPLIYVLTRLSFRLFGINTFATRLPDILVYLVALAAVFRFTRHRMGTLFAGFAVTVLLLGKSFELAVEARPYALLLGFLALALVAWQQATESSGMRRTLALAGLAVAAAGMLLSHIFAVPALCCLIAGQVWHAARTRRFDTPVFAALLLPFAVTAIYIPMLQNHGNAIYPAAFQPDGQTIFDFYIGAIERELIALLLTGLLVLVAMGPARLRAERRANGPRWAFPQREWVAIFCLLSLPLALMLQLMHSHGAFFPRYGAAATLGFVLLTAALLARWTGFDGRAALLGMVVALLISDHTFDGLAAFFQGKAFRSPVASEPHLAGCTACMRSGSLPLVDASGLTFLEMNHHEPAATLDRVYYLTDKELSTSYAHANIFEQIPALVDRFHLRGRVQNYHAFLQTHSHFYVLGKYDWPEDWLLRKLVDDGANVRVLHRIDDEYRDKELYEVTLP